MFKFRFRNETEKAVVEQSGEEASSASCKLQHRNKERKHGQTLHEGASRSPALQASLMLALRTKLLSLVSVCFRGNTKSSLQTRCKLLTNPINILLTCLDVKRERSWKLQAARE